MKGATEVLHIIISANKGNNSLLLHLIPLSGLGLCNYLGYGVLAQKAASVGTGGLMAQWGFTTCPLHTHFRISGRAAVRPSWVYGMWKSPLIEESTNPWGKFVPVPPCGLSAHAEGTDLCLSQAGPKVLEAYPGGPEEFSPARVQVASNLHLFPFLDKAASASSLSK